MLVALSRIYLFALMVVTFTIGNQIYLRRWAQLPSVRRLDLVRVRAARWCRIAAHLFRITLTVEGRPSREPAMVIANHQSYLDPIILMSTAPAVFVTSRETEATPFLGSVCTGGGCVFVDRRNPRHAAADMGHLADLLLAGAPVTIYPEATSTDGSRVKAFHSTMLEAPIRAGVPLQPLVFRFERLDGQPVTRHNRDRLCWYGDMTFLPHFLGLLRMRSLHCRARWLPPISSTGHDRRSLAAEAHRVVAAAYEPIR